MNPKLADIWVYLAPTPLLGLTLTLVAYLAAVWLFERSGRRALLNPVLTAVTLLVVLLVLTRTPYDSYFEGAQFVHFLLGPATVALAVPLYSNLSRLRRLLIPMLIALGAGCLAAAVPAILVAQSLGASRVVVYSLAPKSATTPVAMGVAEQIGGIPSLTAVLVILTGMLGAVFGPELLQRLRVDDDAIRGFSLGVAAHGIGTARAFQMSETAGAFSGLAMGLNALATPFLVPIVLRLVGT